MAYRHAFHGNEPTVVATMLLSSKESLIGVPIDREPRGGYWHDTRVRLLADQGWQPPVPRHRRRKRAPRDRRVTAHGRPAGEVTDPCRQRLNRQEQDGTQQAERDRAERNQPDRRWTERAMSVGQHNEARGK